MGRKVVIWVMVFFIFILAITCGFFIAKNIGLNGMISSKRENEISPEEIRRLEVAKVVNSKEEKIGANTDVVFKTTYSLCGHTEEELADKTSVVNLTEKELQNTYKDWRIITFSELGVELEKDIDGICGEHFMITEEDGLLVVYRRSIDEETGQIGKEEYMTTDISVEYLPEEDLSNIRNGEEIYSREALNKFLEDYE